MSVASKNLFALLEDDAPDSNPEDSSAKPQEPAPNTPQTASRNQRGRGGPTSRGGRYYQRGGAKSSLTPAPETDDQAPVESRARRSDGERGRGRGRGGRGGNRGGTPRRGREFDRQSGTLPDSEKRVHQGWGGDDGERELRNEEQALADASAESTNVTGDWAGTGTGATDDWAGAGGAGGAEVTSGWDAPPSGENAPAEGGDAVQKDAGENRRRRADDEEEDNTLTLDQYLAKQKGTVSELVPKLEGRKANEGADADLWKNVVQVERNDENYFAGKSKSAPKQRVKKAEKETIEIEARFDRPARGGRGRGRGADERRGGGGRGRGRASDRSSNGATINTTLNVDDQSAFPSLS